MLRAVSCKVARNITGFVAGASSDADWRAVSRERARQVESYIEFENRAVALNVLYCFGAVWQRIAFGLQQSEQRFSFFSFLIRLF